MQPQTFIFIGRSGSGKGTQVELLTEYLKKQTPQTPIFSVETGKRFRQFIERNTYTSKLSNEIYKTGDIQPEFLAVALWANSFIEDLKGHEHIFLDGCPRRAHEAVILHSALEFYGRVSANAGATGEAENGNTKPHVIYVNVGDDWAKERLMARHRVDDTAKDIEVRLGWYETQVKPTVEFYRSRADYHFVEINGEQAIEKVHADIVSKINLR